MAEYKRRKAKKFKNFVMITHQMMNSEAWKALKPVSRAALLEVSKLYNGTNNGDIYFSCRKLAAFLGVSKDTASRALLELEAFGFLVCEGRSSFNYKLKIARRWRLTNKPSAFGVAPTDDWKMFDPKTRYLIKDGIVSK